MMDNEFTLAVERIQKADFPEDLFGQLNGPLEDNLQCAKRSYRLLAKIIHPQTYLGDEATKKIATEIFKKLDEFWLIAEKKLKNGTYGNRVNPVTITSRKHKYIVEKLIQEADVCNVYECTYEGKPGLFKVARDSKNNDLVKNEATSLKKIKSNILFEKYFAYVPGLIESFIYKEDLPKQANTFTKVDGLYTLEDVKRVYPNGIDPKDQAWIFRRLLVVLALIHKSGIIHGAILPNNVLIHPREHGLVLSNFIYSTEVDTPLKVINAKYRNKYPSEVFNKEKVNFGLDLYMAAQLMVDLSSTLPKPLQAFFRGCTLKNPRMRPTDALELREEFGTLIEKLWGPRKFHKFTMPE